MQLHFIIYIRKVTVKVLILNCLVLAKIYPAGGGQISAAIFIDAGTHHVVVVVLPIVHEHGAAAHLGAALLLRVHLHLDLVRRECQVRGPLPAAADDAPAGDRGHLAIEGRVVDPPRHAGGGVGVQVYLLRQLHDGAVVGRFEGALAPRMLVSWMLHLASDLYVSREWLPPRSHMGQIMGPDSYLKPDM